MTGVQAMKELLNRLRSECGDDWHKKLAQEMTQEDRDALREAIERFDGERS